MCYLYKSYGSLAYWQFIKSSRLYTKEYFYAINIFAFVLWEKLLMELKLLNHNIAFHFFFIYLFNNWLSFLFLTVLRYELLQNVWKKNVTEKINRFSIRCRDRKIKNQISKSNLNLKWLSKQDHKRHNGWFILIESEKLSHSNLKINFFIFRFDFLSIH